MMKKFMKVILISVLLTAVFSPVLPFILLFLTENFPGRLIFSLLFAIIGLERTYSMFSRLTMKRYLQVEQDWTAMWVGVAYLIILYFSLIEFYVNKTGPVHGSLCALGFLIFSVAVAIRYWALAKLTTQWHVHVDSNLHDNRQLITDGPYKYIRHPLYIGAVMEVVGIPLIFNSYWTVLAAFFLFIPFEIYRAYFEERYLYELFGESYKEYAANTGAFFPRFIKKPKSCIK